jgi:hypothetical protein
MTDPNDKLDFNSISFDDVIGDGAPGLDTVEETLTQEVEQKEPIDNELDEDANSRGDEDADDDGYELPERETYVEDSNEEPEDSDLEDVTISKQISDAIGFEPNAEYDDTVEGLTEYVRDVSQEVAENQIQELFEQFPEVQRHLDYVLAGGESDQFFQAHNPQNDFGNLPMSEKDTMTQKAVLSQYFQFKGHDQAFIQDMLDDYEDSGKLFDKANLAKDSLAQVQQQQREEMFQQQQEQYQQQEEQREQFWDGVANTLEEGREFAGIRIPDRDKSNFFEYISAPADDNGRTQRDIDYSEADMDIKLAIDYLMFSGFQLEDIIATKAKTESARNLRDRIVSNQEKVRNAKGQSRRKQAAFDPDNLDITALF